MITITTKIILLAILLFFGLNMISQVAINADGSSPDVSAILDLKSSDKGLLTPRMTTAEIAIIDSPADGLIVFNTDDHRFYFYDDGADEWKEIAIGSGVITHILVVSNPTTGEIWMDRNLGASQVATSSTDADAYGNLYQWGRATEGHEDRTSSIFDLSNATTPAPNLGNDWDGKYISELVSPYDWLTPQDNTLWQGSGGTNNPCPEGFRIPTETEWEAERNSWSSNNAAGAFASPLKLTVGGNRSRSGSLSQDGNGGYYWSSTTSSTNVRYLIFYGIDAFTQSWGRVKGCSVRCIKE